MFVRQWFASPFERIRHGVFESALRFLRCFLRSYSLAFLSISSFGIEINALAKASKFSNSFEALEDGREESGSFIFYLSGACRAFGA